MRAIVLQIFMAGIIMTNANEDVATPASQADCGERQEFKLCDTYRCGEWHCRRFRRELHTCTNDCIKRCVCKRPFYRRFDTSCVPSFYLRLVRDNE
uniref:Putative til domain protein n=1 Tax=Ixodes ricinus TaxID=34613 RepID=A0A0K8R527_IXORI